jgi:hypothetical protein
VGGRVGGGGESGVWGDIPYRSADTRLRVIDLIMLLSCGHVLTIIVS